MQCANNKTCGGFGLRLKNVNLVEEFGNEQIKSDLKITWFKVEEFKIG